MKSLSLLDGFMFDYNFAKNIFTSGIITLYRQPTTIPPNYLYYHNYEAKQYVQHESCVMCNDWMRESGDILCVKCREIRFGLINAEPIGKIRTRHNDKITDIDVYAYYDNVLIIGGIYEMRVLHIDALESFAYNRILSILRPIYTDDACCDCDYEGDVYYYVDRDICQKCAQGICEFIERMCWTHMWLRNELNNDLACLTVRNVIEIFISISGI